MIIEYLPSEEEIRDRARFIRWMREVRWDDRLVTSIMIYDHPTIDTVEMIIRKHGIEEGCQKLLEFMEW